MTKKKKECEELIKPEIRLKREFITDLKIERRNCGRARALLMMVEIPANVSLDPSYGDFVVLASKVFHDTLPEMDLHMSDADVMAWSDRRADLDHWLDRPYLYRVNATFVPKEDLNREEGEETPAP